MIHGRYLRSMMGTALQKPGGTYARITYVSNNELTTKTTEHCRDQVAALDFLSSSIAVQQEMADIMSNPADIDFFKVPLINQHVQVCYNLTMP